MCVLTLWIQKVPSFFPTLTRGGSGANSFIPVQRIYGISAFMQDDVSEHIPELIRTNLRTLCQCTCEAAFVRIDRGYMCPAFFQIAFPGGAHCSK